MKNNVIHLLYSNDKILKIIIIALVVISIIFGNYSNELNVVLSVIWMLVLFVLQIRILFQTNENFGIELRKSFNEGFGTKIILFAILLVVGARFILTCGLIGAVFLIISMVFVSLRYYITQYNISKSNSENQSSLIVLVALLFIFWFPFKNIVKQEFGVNQIGHIFQSNEFNTKVNCNIARTNGRKTIKGIAELFVSKKLNQVEHFDKSNLSGFYESESVSSDEIDRAKLISVTYNDNILKFNNCIIDIYSSENYCTCENGKEYNIELVFDAN